MPETPSATVLIVDDTEASRYAVSRILRQAGFVVQEAATGGDALRLAAARPDLVILDVQLPDINGYEVCQRLKADPGTAATPVLHLSASFVRSEDRSEGLEGGADGYLTYPLEPRELIATVQALLRVRKAEREVRTQGELLRVTLASIGDGVVATDAAGVITFINPVARGLVGWGDDAVGRPIDDVFRFVHQDTGDVIENPVHRTIRTGQRAALGNHALLVARDGTRRPIDDSAAPIRDDEGRYVGVVLVFRDVSERRRMEKELQKRADDLADRDRRKDEFLAMLGHELRNPLAPIMNSAQLLRVSGDDPEIVAGAGETIERQTRHLTRLVGDLLDLARTTRNKVKLQRQWTDLGRVVAHAVETSRPLIDARGHELTVSLPSETIRLYADPARLAQVLENLLTNAAKYTDKGGRIRLTAERQGQEIVLRVSDTGMGISADMLPLVFDPFMQIGTALNRSQGGLGIGLALVRSLMEMHGGRVEARSDGPGLGSEFSVFLPLTSEERAASSPAGQKPGAPNPLSLRVLVVDDLRDSADSLACLLRAWGCGVRVAYDGPGALTVAEEFRPDVVLLDLGLGGMTGFEVAARLREKAGADGAVLVALTGFGMEEDRERTQKAGFQHHMVKPVDLAALRQLLTGLPSRLPEE